MKKSEEFERFDSAMHHLMGVSHSEIKAKLDAEKKAKAKNRPRKRKAKK